MERAGGESAQFLPGAAQVTRAPSDRPGPRASDIIVDGTTKSSDLAFPVRTPSQLNLFLLLTLLLASCSALQDSPPALPQAFSRPQLTIANYWHSMLEHRLMSALECFVESGSDGVEHMLRLPDLVELRCRDFRVADRGRGVVDVTYIVEYRVSMGDSLREFPSGDRLCLTQSGWKIQGPLFAARRGG